MLTQHKAIVTGLFIEIYAYKSPYEYGYKNDTKYKGTADKELVAKQSAYRAVNMVRRLIQGNIHNHQNYRAVFLTLTFKENITDLKTANRHFSQFIKRLNRYTREHTQYIAVPEFQKRGAVHYHLLILNMRYIPQVTLENIWTRGIVNIKAVNRTKGLYLYMTKYITKSFADTRCMSKRRYFHSLPNRPTIINDNDEVLRLYEAQAPDTLISPPKTYKVMWRDKEVNEVKKFEYLAKIKTLATI